MAHSWDALAQRRWSQIPLNLAKPQPTQALHTKRHQTRLTRQGSGDWALVEAPLFMKAGAGIKIYSFGFGVGLQLRSESKAQGLQGFGFLAGSSL